MQAHTRWVLLCGASGDTATQAYTHSQMSGIKLGDYDLKLSRYAFAAVSVLTAALVLGVLIVASRPDPWSAWKPATCMPHNCFCEQGRSELIKQPSNTISSLAFVPVGALIIAHALGVRKKGHGLNKMNLMSSSNVYPFLFGISLVVVGLGSGFYHASLTFAGQTADVLGMYLIGTFLVIYNLSRKFVLSRRGVILSYVIGNAVLFYLLVNFPEMRRYAFAVLLISTILLEISIRRASSVQTDVRLFVTAGLVMAVAFAIWILDITKTLCNPTGWLQGHGFWHLSGAAASGLIFLFYMSERAESDESRERDQA